MRCLRLVAFALLAVVPASSRAAAAFDVEGHRGARGLAPENTLAAFRTAIALGVTTIETDLQVTRDGVLVLSHNARLNPDITRGPDGRFLAHEGPPIHVLTLAELGAFDVGRANPGSSYARQFPRQVPHDGERIPTLQALLDLARDHPTLRLNLETKLDPDAPADAPAPEAFARLLVDVLRANGMIERSTVQSFDWRTLLAVKRLAPALRTSCLTMETARSNTVAPRDGRPSPWTAGLDLAAVDGSVPRLAQRAGCDVWSPLARNATRARIDEAHALGLAVLPWTVNDEDAMRRLIDAGVDGLITDEPDRLLSIVGRR